MECRRGRILGAGPGADGAGSQGRERGWEGVEVSKIGEWSAVGQFEGSREMWVGV